MTTPLTRILLFENGICHVEFSSKNLSYSLVMLHDALSTYEGEK